VEELLNFYNIVNPADLKEAGWFSPHAEFYYCHACTQRMVFGTGTRDRHIVFCANGIF